MILHFSIHLLHFLTVAKNNGGTTTVSVAAERRDVAVTQGLMTLFEVPSQGRVATDRESSGRQV